MLSLCYTLYKHVPCIHVHKQFVHCFYTTGDKNAALMFLGVFFVDFFNFVISKLDTESSFENKKL